MTDEYVLHRIHTSAHQMAGIFVQFTQKVPITLTIAHSKLSYYLAGFARIFDGNFCRSCNPVQHVIVNDAVCMLLSVHEIHSRILADSHICQL